MTILEKTERLQQLADRWSKGEEHQRRHERFSEREADLRELAEGLHPLAQTHELFRQNGIPCDGASGMLGTIEQLQQAKNRFQEDRASIIEDNLRKFKKRFRSHIQGLERRLPRAWERYAGEQFQAPGEDLLTALERFPEFEDLVQQIRKLYHQLQQRAVGDPPRTSDELNAFEEQAEQFSQSWDQLRSDKVPGPVVEFLKAASAEGASLSQLSKAVRDWMDERGLADSFVVQLKAPEA